MSSAESFTQQINCLTHLCLVDSSTITLWTVLFPIAGCLVGFYYDCFTEIPEVNANIVGPDKTPLNAASNLSGSTLFASVLFMGC